MKYVKLKCTKCGHVAYDESNWLQARSQFRPAEMCDDCSDYGYEEVGTATKYDYDRYCNPPDPIDWIGELKGFVVGTPKFLKECLKLVLWLIGFVLIFYIIPGLFLNWLDGDL